MTHTDLSVWKNLRYDVPAAIVVMLVALPLCLGIALASDAPLFSGIIAGVVGGTVVGLLSKSPLSVSGPAAGLTVIVLSAIQQLPTFEMFLMAVVLAGVLQVGLGVARAGVVGSFIPNSVIKGMLAAIGLILIIKQFPYAVGYNASGSVGDFSLDVGSLWTALSNTLSVGALLIAAVSLVFLFWWDKRQSTSPGVLRFVPGPLVVVVFGVAANEVFKALAPALVIGRKHLVDVPVASSVSGFLSQFSTPDFSAIGSVEVWVIAMTLAAVASVESLLSIEAIDKMDPYKRVTPTNRELMAQGVGNMASGMIGGLPVTSVIVRSSANVGAGGRTKAATIMHSVLLLGLIVAIPAYVNLIPLSVLAAILIATGYKLAKPALFVEQNVKGLAYLVPFTVTICAILATDLLKGVFIGIAVGLGFALWRTYQGAISVVHEGQRHVVRVNKDLFFFHKPYLKKTLDSLPGNSEVTVDLRGARTVDLDLMEVVEAFAAEAPGRGTKLTVIPAAGVPDAGVATASGRLANAPR